MVSAGSLFGSRQQPLLGIDISASSVKLVELSGNRAGKLVLERAAVERLEKGWVSEGNIENFDEVAEALRRLVKKSGARTRQAALALPSSAVITRRIVLPAGLSEEELEIQVESEAGHYIPFALDEVSLDFCVVGPSKHSSDDVDVLIAASRKDKVQDRQGLAEAAGLKAVILDVESYASRLAVARLAQTWPKTAEAPIVAVFELGASTSTLQVMQGEEVLFEREQSFGGAQLTQSIARHYGISSEEAENKKRNGDTPDDYRVAVLRPFVNNLTQEIARSLQFFYSSSPYSAVDRILLAGGTAAVEGLAPAVTQSTETACQVVNPFEGMEMGGGVRMKSLMREASTYLTACGLALRRFDK
ncbi:pilus assembly protein PilM [Corticibacter populi]|uniref:Pilus assembly protein PilM n=1 Tax=Corticibacter populi TaxID=1550736 RepID=A0A3M6QUH0_9BURK|nr:pilus assembly protein PilM [Corticibacter populi]RMX06676.1 pilus assembly protein PilM [Corticibacter populi]RZS31747.1 type IV pilus assembly protein PilM [Corticibacter populi]